MDDGSKRYRAFISYSQRDVRTARRLHRALERYRVPKGIDVPLGPRRRLGRFFRDDDEMGASQSLGAALEGALDDSENLIVLCSPAAARSRWVDAEVRRFKMRDPARLFAVIAAGEPNAADPSNECFPPSLKVKIDARGEATGELDEPRAPNLRRDGLKKVRAELAAGLLDVPFDLLWQRDRRRARRTRAVAAVASLALAAVLGAVTIGWLDARANTRIQSARQAVALARDATADGRVGEALTRMAPFLQHRETAPVVDAPLRTLLGWVPAPEEKLAQGIQPVRLRDATILVEPGRSAHDISAIGLGLERVIRSRDGKRLVIVGDQRVVVFDVDAEAPSAQLANDGVTWLGHAFEAPSGAMVVTGAILGPTNGSVIPHLLAISNTGREVVSHRIDAHMLWDSIVGVSRGCKTLLVASEPSAGAWRLVGRALDATGLGEPVEMEPLRVGDGRDGTADAVAVLSRAATAFETRVAFLAEAQTNPFDASDCLTPSEDHRFQFSSLPRSRLPALDLGFPVENLDRWNPTAPPDEVRAAVAAYVPPCRVADPCPVVGGDPGATFALDDLPRTKWDRTGPPPPPRWSHTATSQARLDSDQAIYFERLEFNAAHQLTICRHLRGDDVCFQASAMGEDHHQNEFLRSHDGRFVYWPFGGIVVNLDTLRPTTAERAVPEPPGPHFDFEFDRDGLTLALDGRLVTFLPNAGGDGWGTADDARASERFGVLADEAESEVDDGESESPLHLLASLGDRHYLVVRRNGVLARLDASTSAEVWRITAGGLGSLEEAHLDPERQHVLVMGRSAWRVFRLADGFAVSGLLRPPPVMEGTADLSGCSLDGPPGPDGTIAATCAGSSFAWQPREYGGEIGTRLARVTCTADVSGSALEAVRRCLVNPLRR